MRVYLPRVLFDHDGGWRCRVADWLPELIENDALGDGAVEFYVADILGSYDVSLKRRGAAGFDVPAKTNFIVAAIDGDPSDQADTLSELLARLRRDLADYDWPMDVTFHCWRHHKRTRRIAIPPAAIALAQMQLGIEEACAA